jgi:hypothetical protein
VADTGGLFDNLLSKGREGFNVGGANVMQILTIPCRISTVMGTYANVGKAQRETISSS